MSKNADLPKDHPILIPPTGKRVTLAELAENPYIKDVVDKVVDQMDGTKVSAFNSSI
jgi:hypothetical protein